MTVDTVLPEKQIKLLEHSFALIQEKSSAFAATFYEQLFQNYPQVKSLFGKTDMAAQSQKMMSSLSYIVENLRYPSLLTNAVKNLGVKHVAYGVLPEHYPVFGNALLKSLKFHLGAKYTPEVEAAWTAAYTAIAYLMLEAAERSSDQFTTQTSNSYRQKTRKPKSIPNAILPLEKITVLENSFAAIKDNSTAFAATFYDNLFEEDPQLKQLFAKTKMAVEYQKLIDSLVEVLENLRRPSLLSNIVKNIEEKYAAYGILPAHYPLVEKALLNSLKFYLGRGWTPKVEAVWKEGYQTITSLISKPTKQNNNTAVKPSLDRYEQGKSKLKEIYDRSGERVIERMKDIAPDLSRYMIEFGLGEIYSRPGLDLKSRQIATIAALVVLGNAESQLMDNIHGALNVGCSQEEIVEVMIQMTLYAGFPAVLRALEVAKVVFAERD